MWQLALWWRSCRSRATCRLCPCDSNQLRQGRRVGRRGVGRSPGGSRSPGGREAFVGSGLGGNDAAGGNGAVGKSGAIKSGTVGGSGVGGSGVGGSDRCGVGGSDVGGSATTLRPGDRGATFHNYSKSVVKTVSRPHPHAHLP
jgi:hypothetical protein